MPWVWVCFLNVFERSDAVTGSFCITGTNFHTIGSFKSLHFYWFNVYLTDFVTQVNNLSAKFHWISRVGRVFPINVSGFVEKEIESSNNVGRDIDSP